MAADEMDGEIAYQRELLARVADGLEAADNRETDPMRSDLLTARAIRI